MALLLFLAGMRIEVTPDSRNDAQGSDEEHNLIKEGERLKHPELLGHPASKQVQTTLPWLRGRI